MRISSSQVFDIANRGMADLNQELLKTQSQISTGMRVLTPADDPVASTKIMQLNDELASTKQYISNIDIANNNLTREESSLNGVNDLIQRMQELTISAGNTASLSGNEYAALASEVDSRIDELLNLTNSKNANGDYIFGGFKSREQPFTGDSLSGFRFIGDEGQQYIKIANNTYVPTTDSGKTAFVDIESANKTINTYPSPSNQSNPPVTISVGRVYDQQAYDDFYPEDIVISFNADGNIVPHGKNFTATEKSTGRIILQDQPYIPGREVKIKGVAVKINGNPVSGSAAVPATLDFGSQGATSDFNFTANPETFRIRAGSITQTFVLDANITNTADLAATLNDPTNGNAAKLTAMGLRVDSQGFHMDSGVNISIMNGSANIDTVMGLTSAMGTKSADGVAAKAGDRVFIDSSSRQDIITSLARFSETLKAYDGGPDAKKQISAMVATTLKNLNNAQTSVLNVTSKIGARVNTLEATKSIHLDTTVVSLKVLSDISSLDYAEASTRLSQQSMILQATQQSFIRVSQLTLFSKLS